MAGCKDCPPGSKRPTPHPGPRCVSHYRIEKRRRSLRSKELRVQVTYGITPEDYDALYESQGGVCFICRKAKGHVRRLAVEHDHSCSVGHPPEKGCPECVRCLACKRCNRLIAFLGPEALLRAVEVLTNPPARKILRARRLGSPNTLPANE